MSDRTRLRLYQAFSAYRLEFNAELAAEIGLNQAIALERIEELSVHKGVVKDGHRWALLDNADLKREFPWLSQAAATKLLEAMVKSGLLLTESYNVRRNDSTRWFTLNYTSTKLTSLKSVSVLTDDRIKPVQDSLLPQEQQEPVPEPLDQAVDEFTKIALKELTRSILEACRLNPKTMTGKDWGQVKWCREKLRSRHPERSIEELAAMIRGFGLWWSTKRDSKTGEPFLSPRPHNIINRWEDYLNYCHVVLNDHIPTKENVTRA